MTKFRLTMGNFQHKNIALLLCPLSLVSNRRWRPREKGLLGIIFRRILTDFVDFKILEKLLPHGHGFCSYSPMGFSDSSMEFSFQ